MWKINGRRDVLIWKRESRIFGSRQKEPALDQQRDGNMERMGDVDLYAYGGVIMCQNLCVPGRNVVLCVVIYLNKAKEQALN